MSSDHGYLALRLVNAVAAVAGGAFGILAVVDPGILLGTEAARSPALDFYVEMYALRSVVLAAAIVASMIFARRLGYVVVVAVLALAGTVQLGDLVIAIGQQTPGVAGAALAAAIHLGSSLLTVRARATPRSPEVPAATHLHPASYTEGGESLRLDLT